MRRIASYIYPGVMSMKVCMIGKYYAGLVPVLGVQVREACLVCYRVNRV
jgi:hypothetical protein